MKLLINRFTGLIILVILLLGFSAYAQNPYYLKKIPLKGEGTYAFLRRFHLDDNSCNLKKFLELNNLEKTDNLFFDKEYKLPILIYAYNGKSIRSTIGNNNYDLALQIQKYNELILSENLRKTHYTESEILWVPFGMFKCPNSISVVEKIGARQKSIGTKTVKLFGNENKKVEIEDKLLENRVFYIVSGHGGPDPGARYLGKHHTLCEDEYAYDVALRLARNLIQHSAIVYIIIQDPNDGIRDKKYLKCDKDEKSIQGKSLPRDQVKRLKLRCDDINRNYRKYKKIGVKSQTSVVIHVDSRSYQKRQDVFFYYYFGSKQGKRTALAIHEKFAEKYRKVQKGRGYHGTVSARNLYVLKHTLPTAVFLELGNIRNTYDQKRIILPDNRQALANWIYLGLKDALLK
ncbi:MAG: N-acetylmuramoyl-L-alanine amidase [Chlorobi bacterium]|nr:N-acetylmuramoyl-L-alanine amidase [Chlorobiota bacterium]